MSFSDVINGTLKDFQYTRTGPKGKEEVVSARIEIERGTHQEMGHSQASGGHFPPPIPGHRTRNIPGTLHIKYKILCPEDYEIRDRDVYYYPQIPFDTMVVGGKIIVELPDGKKSALTLKPYTPSGKKFRMKSKGLPIAKIGHDFMGRRYTQVSMGDFYVVPQVLVPNKLTQEQIQAMDAAAKTGLFGETKHKD